MPGEPAASVPTGSRVALAVLLALVVLSPWPFGSVHLRTTQAIALVSLATALGAFLWDGWRRKLLLPPWAILWPLLGLWALAVFQLIPLPEAQHRAIAPGSAAVWHPDVPAAAAVLGPGPHPISLYPEATRRWLVFATGVVALALAAGPALRERRLLLRASIAVVSGAVLVAMYGLVARLVFGNKLYGQWSVPTVAPFGPFVSKNHFAGYVELAALLAVGLASGLTDEARRGPGWLSWIESRRAKWIVTAWGAVFVLVLAVPVSLSRGGVVSLYIGVLMFGVLRLWTRGSPRLSARGLAIGIAAVVLAVAPVAALLPVEARVRVITLTRVTTDQSGSFRIAVWRDSLRLIASSPWVGSGFGAYEDALPRFKAVASDHRVQRAESDYVEFLADGGAVGGVLLASLASVLLVSGVWVPISAGTGRLQGGVRTGGLAGIVAMGVHSIFDFNLHIPSNALLCVMLATLALHAAAGARPDRMPSGAGRRRMLPMAAVLAVTAVVALRTPWSEVRVDPTLLNRAAAGRPAGLRWTSLREEVAAHLHRRPTDSSAWVILAWVRAPSSRPEAAALATWAVQLDPRHEALRRAAARHY